MDVPSRTMHTNQANRERERRIRYTYYTRDECVAALGLPFGEYQILASRIQLKRKRWNSIDNKKKILKLCNEDDDRTTSTPTFLLFCMSNRNWWLRQLEGKNRRRNGSISSCKSITQFAFHYLESHFGKSLVYYTCPTFSELCTLCIWLGCWGEKTWAERREKKKKKKKKTSIHPSSPQCSPFFRRSRQTADCIRFSTASFPSSYSN